jgi:hypothetical protein
MEMLPTIIKGLTGGTSCATNPGNTGRAERLSTHKICPGLSGHFDLNHTCSGIRLEKAWLIQNFTHQPLAPQLF